MVDHKLLGSKTRLQNFVTITLACTFLDVRPVGRGYDATAPTNSLTSYIEVKQSYGTA